MSTYEIKTESLEKLWKGLNGFSSTAANEINTYLHGAGYTLFSKSIEDLIPVSDRKKKHAKYSNALQDRLKSSRSRGGGFENLSVTIGSKTKYDYLYFPDDGSNTVHHAGNQHFFDRGIERKEDEAVDEMLDRITFQKK